MLEGLLRENIKHNVAEMMFILIGIDKSFISKIMDPLEIFGSSVDEKGYKKFSSNKSFLESMISFIDPMILAPSLQPIITRLIKTEREGD
jgi:hypothetical protein